MQLLNCPSLTDEIHRHKHGSSMSDPQPRGIAARDFFVPDRTDVRLLACLGSIADQSWKRRQDACHCKNMLDNSDQQSCGQHHIIGLVYSSFDHMCRVIDKMLNVTKSIAQLRKLGPDHRGISLAGVHLSEQAQQSWNTISTVCGPRCASGPSPYRLRGSAMVQEIHRRDNRLGLSDRQAANLNQNREFADRSERQIFREHALPPGGAFCSYDTVYYRLLCDGEKRTI